jgi:hypothetical protein
MRLVLREERSFENHGGPAMSPTLPASLVPRAKITVTALHAPERPFSVVGRDWRTSRGKAESVWRREMRRVRKVILLVAEEIMVSKGVLAAARGFQRLDGYILEEIVARTNTKV